MFSVKRSHPLNDMKDYKSLLNFLRPLTEPDMTFQHPLRSMKDPDEMPRVH